MRGLVFALGFVSSTASAGGYVRVDVQRAAEVRLGLFAPVSDVVAVMPEVRASGRQAELNVAVTGDVGALYVAGWVGGGVRFDAMEPYLAPGLAFTLEAPPLPFYFESWTEVRSFHVFGGDRTEMLKRDIVLIPLRDEFAIGPQFEPHYTFPGGLESVHIGPRANLAFGADAIGLFAGWDPGGAGFLGRLTLLLRW